jgi:hypothetical protein
MEGWRAGRIIVALLASFSLASCSGSSSDTVAGGGIGGTGYVGNGTITAFGSIVVNGVKFNTANANVIIGGRQKGIGNQAVLDNLDLGQAVVVEGSMDDTGSSGTAARVMFAPNVRGPVTEITGLDTNAKRVVVLGQTIITDDSTAFRNTTIRDLALDNLIEVSGLVEVAGVIRATHVKKIADSFNPLTEVEVKGMIQDLDLIGKTFKLNALIVYYGLAQIGSLPDGTPRSGQLVHVRGKVGTGVRVEATEIDLADETRITSADRVDLEGFITDFASTSDFTVSYVKLQAHGNTKFIGGLLDEVAQGARIRVRGRLVGGILQAQQILFLEKIRIESRVASKDMSHKTLSLSGLNEIGVTVTSLTRISGSAKDFDQIQAGDHIRVRGRLLTGASVLATKMEVIPSSPNFNLVILQGPVNTISRPEIVILGITVDTTTIPDSNFEGVGGTDQRTEFFGKVQPGSLVRVRGQTGTTGGVTWEGISLEEGQ